MKKLNAILLLLAFYNMNYGQDILLLKTDGKVVIGDTSQITTPGDYNLYVQNGILTESVKVSLRNSAEWSDDAWDRRPTLEEMKAHITKNLHLIDMPSVDQLIQEGYELKEMDSKQLAQIEWLWTYVIELESHNKQMEERMSKMEAKLNALLLLENKK